MSLIGKYYKSDTAQRQEMFYQFMKDKRSLKEQTAKQYAFNHAKNSTLINKIYEVSKKNNLFDIVDVIQVDSIYSKIISTEENVKGHNALSATVLNYKKFLDYLETGVKDSVPDTNNDNKEKPTQDKA